METMLVEHPVYQTTLYAQFAVSNFTTFIAGLFPDVVLGSGSRVKLIADL